MEIIVLGAGMVGAAIARDLAQERRWRVTAVDRDANALAALPAPIQTVCADLRAPDAIAAVVAPADLVVCAVPGFMGFESLQRVLAAGKNVVDISFFGEDPFALEDLAQAQGVTAVVDCGVAPGLSNIIAGYVRSQLDQIDRFECFVGGLPQARHWPFEYKAVFSPIDVIEEYTRPARLVENGREVVRPALSEIELRDFPGVGTLEAFNTDGLRTLAKTLDAPFMREKTLRYPGHANIMRMFRESGFFATTPVVIGDQRVTPIALTSRLLFEHWRLAPGEADLTVMQVIIDGRKDGRRLRYTYNLLDHYDEASQTTSMARTTGYTCTAAARLLLDGHFRQKGICPPEYVGRAPGCYEILLADLAHRNIHLSMEIHERASV